MDRARKGKKLSNADWLSRTNPEARIARMKDGTTPLTYGPEHAVDLDTGAAVYSNRNRLRSAVGKAMRRRAEIDALTLLSAAACAGPDSAGGKTSTSAT